MTELETTTLEQVKAYYGKILQTNRDLKTSACCAAGVPAHLQEIVKQLHPEVLDTFYGCASPIPELLQGMTILDLGSGSGRDCFICSQLVGPEGRVIGVDMTGNQINTARKHIDYHTEKFGYAKPNIAFKEGYIEDLESIGIANASVDVVISNCVVNLSPAKSRVLSEIFRVLKPGGELYFSDVFADRRIPHALTQDPVLRGECLGGALYQEDFRRLLARVGCNDYRVVSRVPISLNDADIERRIGMVGFSSLTIRAFRLDLEDRCEDYGQVAHYLGTIPGHPHRFALDDHHLFERRRPVAVCDNTAAMLTRTRYAPHFRVEGTRDTHYGLFACGPAADATSKRETESNGCC